MAKSKRYQVAKAFHDVVAGLPVVGWRKTSNSPILRIQPQECPAFYTFDFQEQVLEESNQANDLVRANLFIILEYWVQTNLSEDVSEALNEVLFEIQTALMNNSLGGLVQRVSEVGSKFKVESAEQRIVSAEVAYKVTYVRKK